MLTVPHLERGRRQANRKAWLAAAALFFFAAVCVIASGAVTPPRQTNDHSAADENAAAQQAVATDFASALDTLQKTQQAQDAYISSMDSQYQAHDTGGGPGLKGDMMPAGSGLDDKGTEAATVEYMRLQDGTQRNMIDATRRFATGAPLASPLEPLRRDRSREEVDAMMEGEGVESKTGSAMHSSERPSPLADERGAGKALGAAAYANVEQAEHSVEQSLGFAPPDEKRHRAHPAAASPAGESLQVSLHSPPAARAAPAEKKMYSPAECYGDQAGCSQRLEEHPADLVGGHTNAVILASVAGFAAGGGPLSGGAAGLLANTVLAEDEDPPPAPTRGGLTCGGSCEYGGGTPGRCAPKEDAAAGAARFCFQDRR
ncbi:hypothetical protein EMIHUDRAFT_450612 [Emiliania huxleyi CCMP1516]|uniref:Transmembrane protein n=2 Tax=Emiliania huxleyi TaxID=2903 RepID=A0A0D3JK91_EMIH1|nr:hypothetical protein EMIHUDRAFT_450612 [Emiliania huxleyi CCMP1516]EOD23926.1 hypothetical protein EMIHUDRAFT_450612 [Emiliania huxleyi CCMP1516]|eukprot:XP_005776355.1 hypothetical protein EMIHUDRAFT_450612 [Emiliania huxleyi CCMP1516]